MTEIGNIIIHHGGYWQLDPKLSYKGGKLKMCNNLPLGVSASYMRDLISQLGYKNIIKVHYLDPLKDDVRFVYNDDSFEPVIKYVCDGKAVHMYTEHENNVGLIDLEGNISFTELLTRPQLNDIDYDENGTDIDDEEIVDARIKHGEAMTLEKELQEELVKLGNQLERDDLRCEIGSDYENESDIDSPLASSDEDEYGYLTALTPKKRHHKSQDKKFDDTKWTDTSFFVGQKFQNAVAFREEIINYCARNGIDVKYTKNHKEKVGAKCKEENCEWKIWASIEKNKRHFEVKTYYGVHSCGRKNRVTKVTYKWIATHYLKKFKSNPYMKLQEITQSVWTDYGLKVSSHMAFRAKKCAISLIVGEYKEQYALLNNYAAEIMKSDKNNTVKFQLEGCVFRRMYICFEALKKGFLSGCRPFISIDGCWLKGPYGGQLLVAVGRDGNNQMFPIAWAVVDVENTDSWSWFLGLLADDLGTSHGAGYTIMSDQQKGLLKAVGDVWPQAEQRVCARHVYMNFREVFGGGHEYRMHFWRIAKSTTPNDFKENIEQFAVISLEAASDLMGRNYEKWCRAFYTPQSQCDAVDNNMSEVFNAYILDSRHKPIITMLEDIRESIMERMHKKRDFIASKSFSISPRAQEQLEKAKIAARGWNTLLGANFTFGVREGVTQIKYVVDLLNRTCSCNAWQLNGIPCHHTVAAIWHIKEKPEMYVSECYKKATYLKAYGYLMEPLNGAKEWPTSQQPQIKAPELKKVKVGRPKKLRRPGPGENSSKSKKSRVGSTCLCSICGQSGHNIRGCKLHKSNRVRSNGQRNSSKKTNSKGQPSSHGSHPANPPMHNRGIGMYTYPNGFQRLGNMCAISEGNNAHGTSSSQQSVQGNESSQWSLVNNDHVATVRHTPQVNQVAYYSDFEGQQTLRGITTMRDFTIYERTQTSTTSTVPSFIDSSGRNYARSRSWQSLANKTSWRET